MPLTSQQLIDAINNTEDDYADRNFRARSYSGRGMMGEYCVGFSTKQRADNAIQAIIDNNRNVRGLATALRRYSSESLGMGIIIYFPNFEWVEQE